MKDSQSSPAFLSNLDDQLVEHLSDHSLDVYRVTRLIGMSRSNLHRKLNQTVGMSTTEYMRYFRLQKAAKLINEHPDWNIYRVAIETGFNSLSYFSRRFKELFGVCPARWRERY